MRDKITYFLIDGVEFGKLITDWTNSGQLDEYLKETDISKLTYDDCYLLFKMGYADIYRCSRDFEVAFNRKLHGLNSNHFDTLHIRIFDKEEELKLAYSKTPDKTLYSKEKFPPKKIVVPLSAKEESLIVS